MTAHRDGRDEGNRTESDWSRLAELVEEYRVLQQRYGILAAHPGLARFDQAVRRRQFRLKHLRDQLAEIETQLRWLESEMASIDKGRELLLAQEIDEVRHRFKEAWSPAPVLGYRMWMVRSDGFHGVAVRWKQPSLQARCLTTHVGEEVPHTDGRCGQRPCGIYAAKHVRPLLESAPINVEPPRLLAVGLVGLSGKVVEHQHGYRGANAIVLALALDRGPVNPLLTNAPAESDRSSRNPACAGCSTSTPSHPIGTPSTKRSSATSKNKRGDRHGYRRTRTGDHRRAPPHSRPTRPGPRPPPTRTPTGARTHRRARTGRARTGTGAGVKASLKG